MATVTAVRCDANATLLEARPGQALDPYAQAPDVQRRDHVDVAEQIVREDA